MTIGKSNILEIEIAKGERDDVFEDYPGLKRIRMQSKPRSKTSMKIADRNVPRVSTGSASARIAELARPKKQRVLNTLNEKAAMLPAAFVDNLIRIIEAESCLTPEEAARVFQRKKRDAKKTIRLPLPSKKKRKMDEVAEDAVHATTLDYDAIMCQYLIAERFVKSILDYRHETQEGLRKIADAIMKRLMSMNEYADVENGDRATQQLRLLADVVARWITRILEETEIIELTLKEDKQERVKKLEVGEDSKTNDKDENRMGPMDEMRENEDKSPGTGISEDNPTKERNEDDKDERERLDDREGRNENLEEIE